MLNKFQQQNLKRQNEFFRNSKYFENKNRFSTSSQQLKLFSYQLSELQKYPSDSQEQKQSNEQLEYKNEALSQIGKQTAILRNPFQQRTYSSIVKKSIENKNTQQQTKYTNSIEVLENLCSINE